MKKLKCYRFIVAKTYLDKGWSLTSYVKYAIALFGAYSIGEDISMNITVVIGLIYGISCYILGRLWYKFRLTETEVEIGNKFNPFVGELREQFGLPNNRNI